MAAKRRDGRPAAVLLACALLGGLAAAPAFGQGVPAVSPGPAAGAAWSAASRKVARPLRVLAEEFRAAGVTPANAGTLDAVGRFSSPLQRVDDQGRVQVQVRVTDAMLATLAALSLAGLDVELASPDRGRVQGWVAVEDLEGLATEPAVVAVRRPRYATRRQLPGPVPGTGTVTSQGDAIHRCDEARALGFTGAGVTVGVISDGVSGLAQSKSTGNVPATAQDLTPGGGTDGDEGTAMMEIIHDCAPGAQLLFSGFVNDDLTADQFIQAVSTLITAGAHVIVDDLGYYTEPFFEDGDIASNDRVQGTQVLRASAAGNDQGAHYQGIFTPGGSDPEGQGTRHRFAGVDELLRISFFPGVSLVALQWDEPFGQAESDYRLCLRTTGGTLGSCSADAQVPGEGDDPLDTLVVACGGPQACPRDLQITRVSGTGNRTLKVYCVPGCVFVEHDTPTHVVFGHPGVPEVLAVGAARATTPAVVEDYSSHGPSAITFPAAAVRPKPDVTGIDCVSTSRPGFTTFCGTSAAAPHVAAIAALVLEQDGSLTPAELRERLTTTAVDLLPAGFDDAAGFGRADALFAVENTIPGPPPPPPPHPGPGLALSVQTNGASFQGGDTIVVTATVQPGASATVVDAYVVVRVPDGSFVSILLGGQIVPGVVPIVRSFVPVAFTGELVRFTFTGLDLPGDYVILSVFTLPGTLTFVSPLDSDPFSVIR